MKAAMVMRVIPEAGIPVPLITDGRTAMLTMTEILMSSNNPVDQPGSNWALEYLHFFAL